MENKYKELLKYSNPSIVKHKLNKYMGTPTELFVSSRNDKKYMIKTPDDRWVHFGQMKYSDYSKHQDDNRRRNYLLRASNIKGDWKSNKYSPNNLSMNILW